MLGHNFVDVYLNDSVILKGGSTLRKQVVGAAKELLNGFKIYNYCTVIRPGSATVKAGGTTQLQAFLQINGSDLTTQPLFTWTTPAGINPVATVSGGLVTGAREGSVLVTATDALVDSYSGANVDVKPSPKNGSYDIISTATNVTGGTKLNPCYLPINIGFSGNIPLTAVPNKPGRYQTPLPYSSPVSLIEVSVPGGTINAGNLSFTFGVDSISGSDVTHYNNCTTYYNISGPIRWAN